MLPNAATPHSRGMRRCSPVVAGKVELVLPSSYCPKASPSTKTLAAERTVGVCPHSGSTEQNGELKVVLFKYNQYFQKSDDAAFDRVYEAATNTPHSGIYRCEGCGRSVTSVAGYPLPPQNHHQHTAQQGRIRWRLAASHS